MRVHVLFIALLFVVAGCDRPSSRSTTVQLPKRPIAQVTPLTQLEPNRAAHVAVDTLGNVFYSLETERGNDGVVVVAENGTPRATQLTSANILAAMGESVGGSGTIQDLVAGPDGAVWFYFLGGKGRSLRACVGQFLLRNESIQIVFDTRPLSHLSGMGDSIGLARGTLLPAGNMMRLLLRHTDSWALFSFDNRRVMRGIQLQLDRPFVKVWSDDQELDLTRDRYVMSPGVGENMLLLDRATGMMWQVDPIGRATVRILLTGLPSELSRPVVIKGDHLMIFAAESPRIEADVTAPLGTNLPRTSYPALLDIAADKITAIGRDDLRVYSGFPVYAIRIHELVAAPDGSLIGYDLGSGQLLRIRLTTE